MINVAVCGSNGKMGKTIVNTINEADDMTLVAQIDIFNGQFATIKDAKDSVKIDILVDFTQPDAVYENALYCLNNNIGIVIGTTGLTDTQIDELKALSKKTNTGCLIAPNFSTGAVLLMQFAKMASKYFDNAEIIEFHHNQKKDAPSGTAVRTAQIISKARNERPSNAPGRETEIEGCEGARGALVDGVPVHSVRSMGFVATQEVIFGSMGQTLTIRHDSWDRSSYMPGVLLGIRSVGKRSGLIVGLENFMTE